MSYYLVDDSLKKGQKLKIHGLEFTIEDDYDDTTRGDFGRIYRISNNDTIWALKSIIIDEDRHIMNIPNYKALMNEARLSLNLDINPNLVTYITISREKSNVIYIIMEYMENGTLNDLIGVNGIDDFKLILDIAIDIANGMYFLHSNGIVHRDLNPFNVMLDKSPFTDEEITYSAKIIDLGISYLNYGNIQNDTRVKYEKGFREIDSEKFGNSDYISPEQLRGLPAGKEKETDVFAFGMLIYRMITGKKAIDQEKLNKKNGYDISKNDLEKKIFPGLDKYNKEVSPKALNGIGNLIVNCLHYYPKLRLMNERKSEQKEFFEIIKNQLLEIRKCEFQSIRNIQFEFPNKAFLLQMRGGGLIAIKDYENAKNRLLESLIIDYKNVSIIRNLGLVYLELTHYDLSLKYLDKAIGITPKDAFLYAHIGIIFAQKGYPSKYAIECYDKALELQIDNMDANLNKGILLCDVEDDPCNAKIYLIKALKVEKNDPLTNYYLGYCHLKLGNRNLYESFFRKSINDSGHSAEYYIKVCNKLIEYGKTDLAIKLCKEGRTPSMHPKDKELNEIEKILDQCHQS